MTLQVTPPSKDEPPASALGPLARAGSLLDFVAAVVTGASAPPPGCPPELAVELGAVGEAARWTNAALLEALAAVDRGLAAAAEERAACTKQAPPAAAAEGSDVAAGVNEEGGRSKGASEEGPAEDGDGGASEAGFAQQLGAFLAGAEATRGDLVQLADACRNDFQALAAYLGEPPATAAPEVRSGRTHAAQVPRDRRLRAVTRRTALSQTAWGPTKQAHTLCGTPLAAVITPA